MPFQWLWIGVISTREDVTCLWQVEEGKQDYVDTCFTAKVKTGKCVFYWKWAENVSFVYVCEEKQTYTETCAGTSVFLCCVCGCHDDGLLHLHHLLGDHLLPLWWVPSCIRTPSDHLGQCAATKCEKGAKWPFIQVLLDLTADHRRTLWCGACSSPVELWAGHLQWSWGCSQPAVIP